MTLNDDFEGEFEYEDFEFTEEERAIYLRFIEENENSEEAKFEREWEMAYEMSDPSEYNPRD